MSDGHSRSEQASVHLRCDGRVRKPVLCGGGEAERLPPHHLCSPHRPDSQLLHPPSRPTLSVWPPSRLSTVCKKQKLLSAMSDQLLAIFYLVHWQLSDLKFAFCQSFLLQYFALSPRLSCWRDKLFISAGPICVYIMFVWQYSM